MLLYKKLKYLYLKKRKDPTTLLLDEISQQTGFAPYEIVLYRLDFKHYTFKYRYCYYALLNDELRIIGEDEI
jgi:hypothetical protein